MVSDVVNLMVGTFGYSPSDDDLVNIVDGLREKRPETSAEMFRNIITTLIVESLGGVYCDVEGDALRVTGEGAISSAGESIIDATQKFCGAGAVGYSWEVDSDWHEGDAGALYCEPGKIPRSCEPNEWLARQQADAGNPAANGPGGP